MDLDILCQYDIDDVIKFLAKAQNECHCDDTTTIYAYDDVIDDLKGHLENIEARNRHIQRLRKGRAF